MRGTSFTPTWPARPPAGAGRLRPHSYALPSGHAPLPGVFTPGDEQARHLPSTRWVWWAPAMAATPDTGFDCSGLIGYVPPPCGYPPPRTVAQLSRWGRAVDVDELRTRRPGGVWRGPQPLARRHLCGEGVLCMRPAPAARCAWTICSRATGRARIPPSAGPEPSTAAASRPRDNRGS